MDELESDKEFFSNVEEGDELVVETEYSAVPFDGELVEEKRHDETDDLDKIFTIGPMSLANYLRYRKSLDQMEVCDIDGDDLETNGKKVIAAVNKTKDEWVGEWSGF